MLEVEGFHGNSAQEIIPEKLFRLTFYLTGLQKLKDKV